MVRRPDDYIERLDQLGASWREGEHGRVVEDFGDADTEYWAVRSGGAGIADRCERETFAISGGAAGP